MRQDEMGWMGMLLIMDVTMNNDDVVVDCCHTLIIIDNEEFTHTHREVAVYSTFLRNEHPSVRRALPPVG